MKLSRSWDALARISQEQATIANMIAIYCADKHGGEDLCLECRELLDYASTRLAMCPHIEDKPTCNRCPTHCYNPQRRGQIKAVMRHSGPRMLLAHPLQALGHIFDELTY